MAILGFFLQAVAGVLHTVIWFAYILLIARAVLSWVSPDPSNPIVQFLYAATEPIITPLRQKIPSMGMLDLSFIVALIGLLFIDEFLVNSMNYYAAQLISSGGGSGATVVGG